MKIFLSLIVISLFVSQASAQIDSQYPPEDKPLECRYVITNEWDTGFTGVIRLHNKSDQVIENWSVSWSLESNIINNTWNAQIDIYPQEGAGILYYGQNLDWNQSFMPDQMIEFGFQGDKQGSALEFPVINGLKCRTLIEA